MPTLQSDTQIFSIDFRDLIRQRVLDLAEFDKRVVAGAVVGSMAISEGDRWSDLDLTFAVSDDFNQLDVLEDWTRKIVDEFDASHLFDLPSGASIYRVFLLPGCLQFDLSFTPASIFGAIGPKFKLLFGEAVQNPYPPQSSAHELFGYTVHHALRARFYIERGKFWQAEYWISSLRDYALSLACHNHGLPIHHGRGFDKLPTDMLHTFEGSLATSLEPKELLRALRVAIDRLLHVSNEVQDLAERVKPQLRQLQIEWEH